MSYKSDKTDHNKKDIILDVDYRENSLINILKERNTININIKSLLIGDFIFRERVELDSHSSYIKLNDVQNDSKNDQTIDEFHCNNNTNNTNNNIRVHYIIERKTVNDLCSSIKDGRFLEQKNRLIDTIDDPSKIIYLIEGDRNKIMPIHNIPKSTLDSAIQNLIFKHNYKVIFTDSPEESADHISLLYKKLVNNDLQSKGTIIKQIKKMDKLNENVFMNMLCAIPGISIKTARVICYKYKNMNELIHAYNLQQDYDSKCSLLSNIILSEKRKIGISLSTRIYKSLFENIQEFESKSSKNKKVKKIDKEEMLSSSFIDKETCLL